MKIEGRERDLTSYQRVGLVVVFLAFQTIMDTFLEFVVLQSTSLKPSNFLLLSSRGIQTKCQNYQGAPSIILMFVKAHHVVAHGSNHTRCKSVSGVDVRLLEVLGRYFPHILPPDCMAPMPWVLMVQGSAWLGRLSDGHGPSIKS